METGMEAGKTAGQVQVEGPTAPPSCLREDWRLALDAVASHWQVHAKEARISGKAPVWIEDEGLTADVKSALLEGEPGRAHEAIQAWQSAWLEAISSASSLQLEATGDSQGVLARQARRLRARVNVVVEESDGHYPPPNSTVHQMFDEARARFASWREKLGSEHVGTPDKAFAAVVEKGKPVDSLMSRAKEATQRPPSRP